CGRLTAAICFLGSVVLVGCSGGNSTMPVVEAPHAEEYFADKTASSGVDFTYRNGQEAGHLAILESLGGGVALIDYDGDGLLDIFVTGGGYFAGPGKKQIKGHPCKLYKNLGGWKFKDVTHEVGLDRLEGGQPWFYTHGAAVADYDNDGYPDLLVTGWGRLALFHNIKDPKAPGGRRFVDVTRKAGLTDSLWSTSAAWADLDGDGFPDLYVCHYVDWSFANHPTDCKYGSDKLDVCPPKRFKALPHVLYRNNGDGTFTDVSRQAGILGEHALKHGRGLGVVIVDVDDDGWPDIYVADDETDNLLYLNLGGMRFREAALERGVAQDDSGNPNGSMGVTAGAYDGSGHFSLFVTNYQGEIHALYRNAGGGHFIYASQRAGIAAIGLDYVGFGTGFIDFDRDGNEDLFITNGHVIRYPERKVGIAQRPVLLRNLRRRGDKPYQVRFADVSGQAGAFFQSRHIGRGAAFGDLDNDGRTDIVISHVNQPVALLQNAVDNGHHWLGVELVGKPYRDAVGAKLTLAVGDQQQVRTILGGGSYLSASDRRILFGLGTEKKVGRLTVRWPSGKMRTQSWDGLAVDRYWRLVQGEPQAQNHPASPARR
ncbi:MAG TPA: CRTAC1 family protein, partial [Gemmataceae bacterium]|nr:CRTAC1 family protein [Gemmataceae bacterium]